MVGGAPGLLHNRPAPEDYGDEAFDSIRDRYSDYGSDDDEVYVLHGDTMDGERVVFRVTESAVDAYLEIIHLRRMPAYLSPGVLVFASATAALSILFSLVRRRLRARRQR